MGGSAIWASPFPASPAHHRSYVFVVWAARGFEPSLAHCSGLSPASHPGNSSGTGAFRA